MDFDTFLEGIFVLGFQDPATHVMAGIVDLHNYIFTYIVFIIIAVFWMLLCIGWDFHRRINRPRLNLAFISKRIQLVKNRTVNHGETLEIVWTITPSLILVAIAIPSFALLYSLDETLFPSVTLKAIGHQWYWSYEYGDKAFVFDDENNSTVGSIVSFDSNMVPEQELKIGELRLLQVDNPIILPMDLHVRIIVTSADVLHSWAVPSLGIKIDGVPGRLNQVYTFINHEGTFYGQCSELCGVNHGFMPIVIYSVSVEDFNVAFANQGTI